MKPHDLAILNEGKREAFLVSKRGCSHCRKGAERLSSEETCPKTYCCSICKSHWIFVREVKMDIEDFLAMSKTEQAKFLSDEGLLGIDLVWE